VKLYLFNLPDSIICCFSFGRVFRPRRWGRAVGHAHSAAPSRLPAGGRSLGRAFSGRACGLPSWAAPSAAPSLAAPSWPRLCKAMRFETLLYCQRAVCEGVYCTPSRIPPAQGPRRLCVCASMERQERHGERNCATRVFALSAKCACDCPCLACSLVARLSSSSSASRPRRPACTSSDSPHIADLRGLLRGRLSCCATEHPVFRDALTIVCVRCLLCVCV
jgi:hypothetical protein